MLSGTPLIKPARDGKKATANEKKAFVSVKVHLDLRKYN
jgi:hypothetical protein